MTIKERITTYFNGPITTRRVVKQWTYGRFTAAFVLYSEDGKTCECTMEEYVRVTPGMMFEGRWR